MNDFSEPSAMVLGVDAVSGDPVLPGAPATAPADIARLAAAAGEVFDAFRGLARERRARLLDAIADQIEAIGDALITTAMSETGLARGRLEGERGRTTGQLRLFAGVVRDGAYLERREDAALPDRVPPRPSLRMHKIALGPVAVFAASNFPLAFSVAGGDTASALAVGCPVVVKAHPAHPGVSRLVEQAVRRAIQAEGLPDAIFAVVYERGFEGGLALVGHPAIKAVGFTGSRAGGRALMAAAAARPEPIPVFAEMSSINPVILLPYALTARGEAIAQGFAAALTLGSGQFCTNPGLVLGIDGPDLDAFIAAAGRALQAIAPAPMLTAGMREAFREGVCRVADSGAAVRHAHTDPGEGALVGASLSSARAADFLSATDLHDEVFGAAALVVRCRDFDELVSVVERLEGQLTVAVHLDAADEPGAARLLPVLERKAGRILANGFGTGVEVSTAMVHGGPWPATSDSRSTSVGSLAIDRFLRPVCYQAWPDAILPTDLRPTS